MVLIPTSVKSFIRETTSRLGTGKVVGTEKYRKQQDSNKIERDEKKVKILKNSGEWNMSWSKFRQQRGEKLTRIGPMNVRVFRELPQTSQ